jgi:hypothetical protein
MEVEDGKDEARDGNSGTGTGYLLGTRPDGDGHGYHFSPMGGTHTRPGVRRVWGGDLILPMGNPWVPVKHSANKIFQPNNHFRSSPTFTG